MIHAMLEHLRPAALRRRHPIRVGRVRSFALALAIAAILPVVPVAASAGVPSPTGPAILALTGPTTPVAPFTHALTTALTRTLAEERAKNHLPGLQAVIRFPNGTVWMGHAGVASYRGPRAMGNLTLLDAGSITKTFVAALTLQLSTQGVLGLDDPLSRWIPGLPYDSGITIRELLDHTSGVDDAFNHTSLLDALDAHRRATWTAAQVLAYVRKPYFAPGHGWAYSNSNYILLGEVIERATGQSLASLLRQRFIAPLHLTHTFLQSEEPVVGSAADGYSYTSYTRWTVKDLSDGTAHLPFTSLGTSIGAAGAIVTSADDLARWALYLYRGKVLPPAQLAEMLDFGLTSEFHPRLPYGLGVQRRSLSGWGSWGHAGSLSGFRAAMRYFPDAGGASIVVMTNSDHVDPDVIVKALLDDIFAPRS